MIKMFTKEKQKGFTLIELVVVIAILGILAAIAIPRFNDVTDNAKTKAAAAEHKSVVAAYQMFIAAKGVPPTEAADLNNYLDMEPDANSTTTYTTDNAVHVFTFGTTPSVTSTAKDKSSTV